MASIFDKIRVNNPNSSVFNLSHEKKLSCNMGDLIPILAQEVIPGDSFRINTEFMLRLAPMIAPIMHRVNVYTHFFFVPNRLVWDNWGDFITNSDPNLVHPQIRFDLQESLARTRLAAGSLSDYMGLPTIADPLQSGYAKFNVSALPFRAYQLIWNEYYRDQNLQQPIEFSTGDGILLADSTDANPILTLRKRAWEKDYFTSALPNTQLGDPVTIPMFGSADVVAKEGIQDPGLWREFQNQSFPEGNVKAGEYYEGTKRVVTQQTTPGDLLYYDPNGTLEANLENVSTATINDLRTAFQLQRWKERSLRSGHRYIESILSHFGVRSSDARLQRPEYLGGGKSPVVVSEVLQTSETNTSPQGNMAGHGFSMQNSNRFKKRFEEHGYIIGILSIIPKTAYQQGVPRKYIKEDFSHYFWPEFANLGEQEVYNKELFLKPDDITGANEKTFGYQARYSEYRYEPSTVHGDMREELDFWHLGRKFSDTPLLNSSFIECNPSTRIFAVEDPDHHKIWVQLYNNVTALRKIPRVAEPGLIDH